MVMARGRVQVRLGLTGSWIHGWRYASAESSSGWVLTTREAILGEVRQTRLCADGGDGFSLTPGVALMLGSRGRVGVCVRDLVAPVRWHAGVHRQWNRLVFDSLSVGRLASGRPMSWLLVRRRGLDPAGGFWASLPGTAAIASGLTLPWMRLTGTAEFPFRPTAYFGATPRFGCGLDLRPLPAVALGVAGDWSRADGWSGRATLGGAYSGLCGNVGIGLAGTKAAPFSSLGAGFSLGYNF
jgi:hypothetical protein